MAIVLTVPVDPLTVDQLVDDGFTSLTLWYADEPDGVYADSGVTPSPATLAAAVTAENYSFIFSYSGGSPTQWFKVRAKTGVTYSDSFLSSPFVGGGGVSLRYLRRRLGELLDDMTVLTTTSGGDADTLNCTNVEARRRADGFFNNMFIYRVATGEESVVDTSTNAGVINVTPAFGTSTTSGTVYELSRRWSHSEYNKAINWACVAAYPTISRPIINTGFQSVDDSYLYDVPGDILTISSVEIETNVFPDSMDQGVRGQPWFGVPFEPVYDNLSLKFEVGTPEAADKRLRISGTGYISQMGEDTDSTELNPHNAELLIAKAAERLWLLKGYAAASSDRDFYMSNAQLFKSMFEEGKMGRRSRRRAKKVWGVDSLMSGHLSRARDRYNSWRFQ